MAKGRNRPQAAVCLLLASISSIASAQEQTTSISVAPTPTSAKAETSSTQATASTTDIPLELWGIANSLLSSYYPSTTISDIASLTWPSVVVIGSSTYTHTPSSEPTTSPTTLATVPVSSQDVNRPLATDTSTASDAEPSEDPREPSGHPKDRTLGIALGVVFGVIAVALMLLALCCVDRRQKKHGRNGLFPSRKRRATSPTDSEVGAWRARHPHMGLVATVAPPMSQANNRPPREWVDRYNRLADQQTPPAHMHPAFMHQHTDSAGSASENNAFFTPADRSTENTIPRIAQHDYHPGYPNSKSGFNVDVVPYTPYRPEARNSQTSYRRSSSSDRSMVERNSRPPTPFSPMMMLQASSPPQQTNPFVSDDDEDAAQRQRLTQQEPEAYEGDDVVSPMQPPSRSPARRHSPLVHYPSWSEVSEFNFTGESDLGDRNVRAQSSSSSGRDYYGRDRESVVGRTELA